MCKICEIETRFIINSKMSMQKLKMIKKISNLGQRSLMQVF